MKSKSIIDEVLSAYHLAVEYLYAHGNNEKAHSSRAFAMLSKMNRAKEHLDNGEPLYALELAAEVRDTIKESESAEVWFKRYAKQYLMA